MITDHTSQIIARCTRGGVVSWQNVAQQLGRSVDSVRAECDPTYMRSHIWAPSREPRPEMEPPEVIPDENDTRSPHERGPDMRTKIVACLTRGCASAETIAAAIGHGVASVRVHLTWMKQEGTISRLPGVRPYTWRLGPDKLDVAEGEA